MANARSNYSKVAPEPFGMLIKIKEWLDDADIDQALRSLLNIRISQLNGCAFCLDIHTREALQHGVSRQKIDVLAAWREAPMVFSELEQAALEWAETITLMAEAGAPDESYEPLEEHFSETQIVALTWAIVAMNSWNRLAVGFGVNPRPRTDR